MGSTFGAGLVNIFMCYFKTRQLRDCLNDFKRMFQKRMFYDIFTLFASPNHADKIKEYSSSNISTQFFSKNDNFAMYMYRKETFTGFYNNFESVIPLANKIGLIKLLF